MRQVTQAHGSGFETSVVRMVWAVPSFGASLEDARLRWFTPSKFCTQAGVEAGAGFWCVSPPPPVGLQSREWRVAERVVAHAPPAQSHRPRPVLVLRLQLRLPGTDARPQFLAPPAVGGPRCVGAPTLDPRPRSQYISYSLLKSPSALSLGGRCICSQEHDANTRLQVIFFSTTVTYVC